MRIGTWNLEGRWTDRHRAFLAGLECDVLLLTEVRTHTAMDGMSICPSSEMVEGRWWAAVASPQELVALDAPHAASAMAEVDGWMRVVSSVLPWNGCGAAAPWNGTSTAERTLAAVTEIEAASPSVWGGDWNHGPAGEERAGALLGRMAILDALERLELAPATTHLPHRISGLRTIDHIAVPAGWQVSAATRVDATGLSDHDAYVVETAASGDPIDA